MTSTLEPTPGTEPVPARERRGLAWFVVAMAAGVLHAVPSLSWALGGDALASTVGATARAFRDADPVAAGIALGCIGLVKLAAAVVPWWVERVRPRGRRFWRAVTWIGAVGITVWGAAGAAGGLLALSGVVVPDGGVDVDAAVGHAFLWDPLFVVWGVALVVGLVRSRGVGAGSEPTPRTLPPR